MALHYYHKTSLGQMLLVNVGVCLRKYSLMKRCCQMVRAEAIAQMASEDVRKKNIHFILNTSAIILPIQLHLVLFLMI